MLFGDFLFVKRVVNIDIGVLPVLYGQHLECRGLYHKADHSHYSTESFLLDPDRMIHILNKYKE
jgi:hypothetical protein